MLLKRHQPMSASTGWPILLVIFRLIRLLIGDRAEHLKNHLVSKLFGQVLRFKFNFVAIFTQFSGQWVNCSYIKANLKLKKNKKRTKTQTNKTIFFRPLERLITRRQAEKWTEVNKPLSVSVGPKVKRWTKLPCYATTAGPPVSCRQVKHTIRVREMSHNVKFKRLIRLLSGCLLF